MKRVLLLGATGMLGSAVYGVLKDRYQLVLAVRHPTKIELLERAHGTAVGSQVVPFDAGGMLQDFQARKADPGEALASFLGAAGDVDFVINAIGVTIPFAARDPALTLFVNGALPHVLARVFGARLIHITTDCVYNGREGFPYDEASAKSPTDLYGLSKSLGEPTDCLTLRTSIIGRELDGFTGLLEWFLGQKGKTIHGFTNHFWNGITTRQFGVICDTIMQNPGRFPRSGLYHVYSTVVSKYEMLKKFQQKCNLDCTIVPENENRLNRTLATVRELNGLLEVPSFEQMLEAL